MSEHSEHGRPGARGIDPVVRVDPASFLRNVVAPDFNKHIEALRARVASLRQELADREGVETSVRIVLRGEGGGTWFVNVARGRMWIADTPGYRVLFSVFQDTEDWLATSAGGGMLGTSESSGRRGALVASRVDRLRGIMGTLQVVVRGGEPVVEHQMTLHFGAGEPAAEPQATVSIHEDDARKLRDGTLDPQAAFLQGRVRINGDMNLAIQVGTALFL